MMLKMSYLIFLGTKFGSLSFWLQFSMACPFALQASGSGQYALVPPLRFGTPASTPHATP